MSDHQSLATLSALADGELSATELASVNEHLATCPACTSNALAQSLLKSATARAGQRYASPADLGDRMAKLASQQASRPQTVVSGNAAPPARGFSSYGWMGAAALLLICFSVFLVGHNVRQSNVDYASLVTEVSDQHIATLAANSPPEIISSDRHTVKPWFQGKIPFSFNLPQNLPADTTLDGANLTYLHDQPTAQLLFSIGKHRVSVFMQQKMGTNASNAPLTDRSGFHVTGFQTADLSAIAISDVDPGRLSDLVRRIEQAQAGAAMP